MAKSKKSIGRIVPVVVPVAVGKPYSYRVPEGFEVEPGSVVRVPLGTREVIGAVWDGAASADVDPKKIREIAHVYPTPPLQPEMRRFLEWVANWTLASCGMTLRMVLNIPEALEPDKPIKGFRLGTESPVRQTPARSRVLELLDGGLAWTKSDLAQTAGVSASVIDGLVKAGAIETVDMPDISESDQPDFDSPGPKLTTDQKTVVEQLVSDSQKGYSVTLLDGVTGSGKTEVFFEAVAETMKQGRQVLVLVPEISLTAQFLDRFEKRFGAKPGEWHSGLSKKRREHVWRNVASNKIKVVIGARSALFLPFANLGLIVIDEEHDGSFKQVERVPYNARDMAVVKGRLENFPVILSSATPSIESRVNADQGRYKHCELKTRATGTELPAIETIDMRLHGPEKGCWLAPRLVEAVEKNLQSKKQSLLFLNRRGYAPLTLCQECGHRFQCVNCSTWLVEHRFRNVILCHHCGYQESIPDKCPNCDSKDSLVACGPGVERVAEEVAARFPDARAMILSSDTGGGIERIRRELKMIENFEVDIVIGTQIVAKGMNFPSLMLVGVVDADLGLSYGDLRAAEKTFQLLAQVTGRAGRLQGKGIGILQSYSPEHPVIRAMTNGDSESFYKTEIELREQGKMPPFGRLAAIVVSASEKPIAEQYARLVARHAPASKEIRVLGPVEAPLAMLRGRYRFRMLVHSPKTLDIQAYFRRWLAKLPPQKGNLKLQIDIDPHYFM